MKKLDFAAVCLIMIGAFNWGCVGLFDLNVIHLVVENSWADRFIYSVVGISAIYGLVYWKSIRTRWKDE